MIDIGLYTNSDRLAILYSGGADSTLLYYLVITHVLKHKRSPAVDLLLIDRYNKPLDKAIHLYNNIKEKISDTISSLKVITLPNNIPGHLQVLTLADQIKNDYDKILWAVNQYPDDVSIRPRSEYTVPFEKFRNHDKLKLPFIDYKKTDIIDTFMKLGINDILEQTHSCGEPVDQPCGECFNCRERRWAYEMLGLKPELGI